MLIVIISQTGTIRCNFDNDWCSFGHTVKGDDGSRPGLAWARKTGKQIQNQNIEGPLIGMVNIIQLFAPRRYLTQIINFFNAY